MRRLHVDVTIRNIDRAIAFYSGLFGQAPTIHQDEYAKWMVEDPLVNFVIST